MMTGKRKYIWLCVALSICLLFPVTAACETEPLAGDTNGNGRVEAADALLVLQMSVGKRDESAYPIYLWDMDSDKRPNTNDALWILRRVVKGEEFSWSLMKTYDKAVCDQPTQITLVRSEEQYLAKMQELGEMPDRYYDSEYFMTRSLVVLELQPEKDKQPHMFHFTFSPEGDQLTLSFWTTIQVYFGVRGEIPGKAETHIFQIEQSLKQVKRINWDHQVGYLYACG